MESSVSYSGSLQNCAMVCSLRRVKHKCKEQFGSYACNNCRYNICEYADIDPKQAKLFVMQTDFEAKDTVSYNRSSDIVFWFFILGFLALGLHSFNYYHPGELWKYVPSYFKQVVETTPVIEVEEQEVILATQPTKLNVNDIYKVIDDVLESVAVDYILGADLDGDGETNCHDAAILFYNYFPYKDRLKIMQNTPMRHIFVAVLIGNVWYTIEPAAYAWGEKSYWMKDVWGKKYNDQWDNNATSVVKSLGWIK